MISRDAEKTLHKLANDYPVVAITGPRQSGKTTIARHTFKNKPYVSLEDPDERQFALEDPRGFLSRYSDGAVIDEAQHCPDLFSYLQTIVDEGHRTGLFVLTGSQQFGLIAKISQSLAGRAGFLHLLPFSLGELEAAGIKPKNLDEIIYRGLYPPIYDRKISPTTWYGNYVLTYIERDVRQMLNIRNLGVFQKFTRMCAARTGQLLNLSALANDCGVTHNTARAWMSVLEASYIVFLLQPHHKNFGKRLVKMPKLYFYDTGLAAYLLGIHDAGQMAIHSMRGALFEAWAIGEMLKGRYNLGFTSNLSFWRDSIGNEVDLIVEKNEKLHPIEIKSGQTLTSDFFTGLKRWLSFAGAASGRPTLIYGGSKHQNRSGVEVVPWRDVPAVSKTMISR